MVRLLLAKIYNKSLPLSKCFPLLSVVYEKVLRQQRMCSFGHLVITHLSTTIDCHNRWKWTSAQSMPKAQPTLCSSPTLAKGDILRSSRETGSLWDFRGTDTYICYKEKSDHIWPQFGLYSNCLFLFVFLFFFQFSFSKVKVKCLELNS